MSNIEGFVSIGTGGMVNAATASGTTYGLLPGCPVVGAPTGWVGGFSGVIGLYGAGVAAVGRVSTGLYAIQLSDDWSRLDSVQVTPCQGSVALAAGGVTGATAVHANVAYHTVGIGNSQVTGAFGSDTLKNQIFVQFYNNGAAATGNDLAVGGGFFIDIRVRDTSLSGPQ